MGKKCCNNSDNPRLNRVGGQAVLEGVMMKAGNRTVTTCRLEDGSLSVNDRNFVSVRKKHKILNIPILRGVVNFVEMLMLSFNTLNVSAEAMGIEEEDGKLEKWLKKHFGVKLTDVIMVVALVLGLAMSLFLFKVLPALVSDGVNYLTLRFLDKDLGAWRAVIEGIVKIFIFVGYLWLTSLMKDIRRTFMYHGAEHKSIACFESGEELTPENAMKHKRFHPRCGTSFMFLMIGLGIVISLCIRFFFNTLEWYEYIGISLLTLPLTMGLGYEILMIAGKHDNFLVRMISAPGLWVQRITTKEPTEDMLEVAITSLKCALRDEFPEFREFYENKGWIKKTEKTPEEGKENLDASLEKETENTELEESSDSPAEDNDERESKTQTDGTDTVDIDNAEDAANDAESEE